MWNLTAFSSLSYYLWIGAAVAYFYTYRHLLRYEAELRKGIDSEEDFRRTMTGMRLFAIYAVVCLSVAGLAGN